MEIKKWFWIVKYENGIFFMPDYMFTEEEVKVEYKDALEYKRMDILGIETYEKDEK